MCLDCHSERDFSHFAGPQKAGTMGRGGERFDGPTAGVPGVIFAPNITPSGVGAYSDGELMRAVTTGVARDGRALFPMMLYPNYGRVAEDDVKAILAYVRTLKAIENHPPERTLDVPVNLIVRTIPRPASFDRPALAVGSRQGRRRTSITHGRLRRMPHPERRPRAAGAGHGLRRGTQFAHPELGYRVRSANITPDADSGIGSWTEEQFINKFKGFESPDGRVLSNDEQRQNTAMPWTAYAGMTRDDLSAIYAYLRTQKPVNHRVDKWPDSKPATATR